MHIESGAMLAGRYRAERCLGRGGMGEVWRCYDVEHAGVVAVKAVREELLATPSAARMFHGEVVTTARLSHPGIVPVYDLVREGPAALLVLQHCDGLPLSRALAEGATWADIQTILIQLLEALAYAHARGVLHLDIKPENIMVERRSSARGGLRATLVDFGIARVRRPGSGIERWFDREAVVGTVEYMAPEQCEGAVERFGPWTDLYAVGTVAYELCAGKRPFPDVKQLLAALLARTTNDAPPLSPRCEVPAGFVEFVADLLARRPQDRPFCAADALAELRALGPPEPTGVFADLGLPHGETTTGPVASSGAWRRSLAETTVVEASPISSRVVTRGAPASRPAAPQAAGDVEAAFVVDGSLPLAGAYGLFGLREVPLLGRLAERRAVWEAVRRTLLEGRTSIVVLDGPAGVGKTRLARDAMERSTELGLAVGLETSWSREGSGDEGLRALVENTLDTRGEGLEQVKRRLEFWLARRPGEDAAFRREVELLLRPPREAQLDAGLPLRVAMDVLELAASTRPAVLLLDDAQWSRGEALALARALAAREPPFPVCVIATARVEDDADRAARDELLALPGVVQIAMDRLAPEPTRVLVRGLLDVDDDLCDLLSARAEGNPLFVTQLLGELVLAEAIERRDGRFRLSRAVDFDAVPVDIAAVWGRRVERSGARALDLAALAITRERVSLEVADGLSSTHGPAFDRSIELALEHGLLHLDGGEYRWTHGLLRGFLTGEAGRDLPRLSRAAAGALAPLVGREDVQEERARHLLAAGDARAACETLVAAGLWSFDHADPAPRERRFVRLAAWADENGFADLAARAHAELAYFFAESARPDVASGHVTEARARLVRAGGDRARPWVAFQSARAARLAGRLDEGVLLTSEALQSARALACREVEALALLANGLDALRSHDKDAARERFHAALQLMEAIGNNAGVAIALRAMSGLHDGAEALALADRAVDVARAAGAIRLELIARQVRLSHLWEGADAVTAKREARSIVLEADRRGLRQVAALVELECAHCSVRDGDWPAVEAHQAGAVSRGAEAGSIAERAHLAAVDLAIAAHARLDVDAAFARLEREAGPFRDPLLGQTLTLIRPLVSPELAARFDALR